MTRALATFQRSCSAGTRRDRWQRGEPVAAAVEAGAALFGGEAWMRPVPHPPLHHARLANNGLESVSVDPGRWRLTGEPSDSGAFKIPTLRNIGFTPYMHDGRFATLEEVVDHYAQAALAMPIRIPRGPVHLVLRGTDRGCFPVRVERHGFCARCAMATL